MIQPIVEGHGEVQAVPVLLRKLAALMAIAYVEVGRPIRRTRTELVAKDRLAQAIELARLQPRCSGIFILFDADDDCPKTLAPQIQKWAADLARGIPAAVVMANREFEAWFLHSLASLPRLRDASPCPSDPEQIRDAKGVLEERMRRGYSETADQARLTGAPDWEFVHKNSRSARKLIKEVSGLLVRSGLQPSSWPGEDLMRKYWHVIKIGFENTLVYRVNFLFRAGFGLIPLLATIYLWRTVYAGQTSPVGGYSLAGMISYYLLVTIVDTLTAVNEDDWQIAADIKDGNISQFLLKPINYLTYRLCLFFSGKIIFTVVSLVPVGLFVFCLRQYLVAPAGGWALVCFLLSTLLAALLQFFMSYTLALLAFWLLEVSTVIFMAFAFEYLAGGHVFPLNILPPALEQALNCTPFPYVLFFPVSVYLGQVHGPDLWRGLGLQSAWLIFFYLLARFVWRRGIRKYSAVGG